MFGLLGHINNQQRARFVLQVNTPSGEKSRTRENEMQLWEMYIISEL